MGDMHPGLEILRELIPDTAARRDFVRLACDYMHDGLTGNSYAMLLAWGVQNPTFEQAIQIDAFIAWI